MPIYQMPFYRVLTWNILICDAQSLGGAISKVVAS